MSPAAQSDAILDHLTGLDALHESDMTRVRAFERWRVQRAPLAPTDERLLLGHLLDREHWTYGTASTFVKSINRYYRATTDHDLSGEGVRSYLAHKKLTNNSSTELVAPLRVSLARDIAARETADPARTTAALRAALVALRALTDLTQPLSRCWARVQTLQLSTDGNGTRLHPAGDHTRSWTLDADSIDVWRSHLEDLGTLGNTRLAFRRSATRAGIDPSGPAEALTHDQWGALWRALDTRPYRSVRNLAYMLVGLGTARRHAELARFDIDHVVAAPDAFLARFWDGKRKIDIYYTIGHVGTDTAPCPAECAACALDDLLTYRREVHGAHTGPAFATHYRREFRRMSRQNGRLVVRALTGGQFSTRSLRAGAATSAWDSGMSLAEIAATVTQHASLAEADKYIRRTGAGSRTLQVQIGRPG